MLRCLESLFSKNKEREIKTQASAPAATNPNPVKESNYISWFDVMNWKPERSQTKASPKFFLTPFKIIVDDPEVLHDQEKLIPVLIENYLDAIKQRELDKAFSIAFVLREINPDILKEIGLFIASNMENDPKNNEMKQPVEESKSLNVPRKS